MKIIRMIIGIAVALMLCITPVAAVSVDFFIVEVVKDEDDTIKSYKYRNILNRSEEYIKITTDSTNYLFSLVTFKPANIDYWSPLMVVDTCNETTIYLPRCVDEWEIKYYSKFGGPIDQPDDKYLKNAGVVNLNEHFGKYIEKGLYLEVKWGQWLHSVQRTSCYWCIPDVD